MTGAEELDLIEPLDLAVVERTVAKLMSDPALSLAVLVLGGLLLYACGLPLATGSWAGLAAVLRQVFGTNEAITTLLLNYIAGLILLAAAPCTAMVFVWSHLTRGDPAFTLSQVALNDTIMVFAFAPIVALLLGLSSITVPWDTLITSVVLYIVIPVVIAQLWRKALLARGQAAFDATLAKIGPWSITALLATLVLLFGFQGEAILKQPLVIAMLAVPILIQVLFTSALAYWLNRAAGEKHAIACPSALIGASNFFELAVAAAISLFGFESGAALATVVGVLIEVPVMLLVVKIVNASKGWYESA